MRQKILVVEDDYIQDDLIVTSLRKAFPHDDVISIGTEQQFRAEFEKIVANPPDVIVMDVMLRWTNPSVNMPPRDEDVKKEGSNRAGFRCKKLLAGNENTKNIPVILYTVLELADISHELQGTHANDIYLLKESDTTPLVRKIRECTEADMGRVIRLNGSPAQTEVDEIA